MSEVDRLLQEYIREHEAGGQADPLAYLARVEGAERLELEALLDGYLAHAERRTLPDPAAYPSSLAERIVEQLAPALGGVGGLWPTVLPDLRNRARIRRSELVARLAASLGVAEREDKVADYYNRMEAGRLPAEGVSDRVLQALGEIVGQSAERLRAMGSALAPGGDASEQAATFARTAPAPQAPAEPPGALAAEEHEEVPAWDEVDELFRGGG